ncbi:MAG: adenosylcobinamide-GDP ribazoletransferase [Pseudomonadota bacterium]
MTGLRRRFNEVRIACMLLTRLPMGTVDSPAPSLADARWAYPLAGLPVGIAAWLAFSGATWVGLGPQIAAWLAVATGALITGGLHHDGLADVADGFWGGHTPERRLEIMRDSRVGSYGVIALIVVLAVLAQAIAMVSPTLQAFIAVAVLSRCAMVLVLIVMPPARKDGLGHAAQRDAQWHIIVTLIFGAGAVTLLGLPGVANAVAASAAATLVGVVALRKIGGQTGDVLGATQLLTATAIWITLAAFA